MGIKFGVAGFPPNFSKSPYKKKRENIFEWIHSLGLDWIELQNTYGVKMSDKQALTYRALAEQYRIGISIHAPYYISFASRDPEVVQRSKERMLQCFRLAGLLGSERIIFHPGYPPGKTAEEREIGVYRVIDALQSLEPQVPPNVYVYPETAGKRNQIGSLRDILTICGAVSYARPCFDMAHIHAFQLGGLKRTEMLQRVFDRTVDRLGPNVLRQIHIHMYPVEYDRNGEKRHKAFADRSDAGAPYYPTAEDFVSVISNMELDTVVICEARDTQDVGAMLMKRLLYGDRV